MVNNGNLLSNLIQKSSPDESKKSLEALKNLAIFKSGKSAYRRGKRGASRNDVLFSLRQKTRRNSEMDKTHFHTFTLIGDKPIEPEAMIDGISNQTTLARGRVSVFCNPYKTASHDLKTIEEVDAELKRVADMVGWESWSISRGDVAIDWAETEYAKLQKINRLFLSMIAGSLCIRNAYESIGMLSRDPLTLRIQDYKHEVEFYNKAIQQPEIGVSARLEFRSKAISENWTLYDIIRDWVRVINEAMTKENYDRTLAAFAEIIAYKCRETGKKPITMAKANEDILFSRKQVRNFLELSGSEANAESFSKNYTNRERPEFISFKDMKTYASEIVEALKAYANSGSL